MYRKSTILILVLFAVPLGGLAQKAFEGVSGPVPISVTSSFTATSKPVYFHVDPGAAGYSKVVHLNTNSTTSSTAIASNKVIPEKEKAVKSSEQKVVTIPTDKAATDGDTNVTTTDKGLTVAKTPEPKKETSQEKITTTSMPQGVVNDNQKVIVDAAKKNDISINEHRGEDKKNVSTKAETEQKVQSDQKAKESGLVSTTVLKDQPTDTKTKEVAAATLTVAAVSKTSEGKLPDAAPAKTLTPESSNVPKYYALLIGVSTYAYASSTFTNLDEPVNDVKKLEKVLVERYEFAPSNVKKLLNPTRLQILDELDQLARNIKEQDNLLIFYAGHGKWDPRSQVGYWLPSDARPDRRAEWIPNSTLQDYINSIYSKHTLLISDACFGGSIFKERKADFELNEFATSKLYQLPSRKAMTSGNLMTVPDRSKFLEYMVKRLNENEDRFLPARILFDRIYLAVINNTNTVPLYGVVHNTGDEGGEFIFIKKVP